jgi:hypothetical protein
MMRMKYGENGNEKIPQYNIFFFNIICKFFEEIPDFLY